MKTYKTFSNRAKQQKIQPFIDFLQQQLNLETLPTIEIINDPEFSKDHKTFGCFDVENDHIKVQTYGRHLMDVYRTLAHEMVHYLQRISGNELDGSTGSDCENEANSRAAVLLRNYTKTIKNHGY